MQSAALIKAGVWRHTHEVPLHVSLHAVHIVAGAENERLHSLFHSLLRYPLRNHRLRQLHLQVVKRSYKRAMTLDISCLSHTQAFTL